MQFNSDSSQICNHPALSTLFIRQVFAVFALYVRCAAIDPADSGIRVATQRTAAIRKVESSAEILLQESEANRVTVDRAEVDFSRSMELVPDRGGWEFAGNLCAFLCFPVIVLSGCLLRSFYLGKKTQPEKFNAEEELLYCSLCEAEVIGATFVQISFCWYYFCLACEKLLHVRF